jgi:hypothetical protein
MRFAKGGHAKKLAYRITGHDEINESEVGE